MTNRFSIVKFKILDKLNELVDGASLAFFRIVFGSVMLYSTIRFVLKGWVHLFYIKPHFFFKYYGFHWVHTLPGDWMFLPWMLMIISLVFIILGKYYRVAIIAFFLLFSYTELLDLTNYLNHYYLITLLSFIMIFLPMHHFFSLDARSQKFPIYVPRWTLTVLRLQVGLVYFFAGLSKIKYDWLIRAEPMKIWLGTCENIPFVGKLLAMSFTAYLFSWVGMLFDLSAPFFLLSKRTRKYEYFVIVVFHIITLWLFYIGIFPLVMMGVALIFFSPAFHRNILEKYATLFRRKVANGTVLSEERPSLFFLQLSVGKRKLCFSLFSLFFLWQIFMPLRYLLYKGNVLWTEQGFRYAWNVMLIEKDGYAEFHVQDKVTGENYIEFPKKYLSPLQEKMMNTQPDMILQYAHFLANKYQQTLHHPVAVFVDDYVSLNRRPGQAYINPKVDLAAECDGFAAKTWILPLKN